MQLCKGESCTSQKMHSVQDGGSVYRYISKIKITTSVTHVHAHTRVYIQLSRWDCFLTLQKSFH
jgi:hypothetical protein